MISRLGNDSGCTKPIIGYVCQGRRDQHSPAPIAIACDTEYLLGTSPKRKSNLCALGYTFEVYAATSGQVSAINGGESSRRRIG